MSGPCTPLRSRAWQVLAAAAVLPPMAVSWTAEWIAQCPAAADRVTPRRSGHAAFVHGTTPYVFGGYAEEEDEEESKDSNGSTPLRRYVVNDLWRWSDDDDGGGAGPHHRRWTPVATTGDRPGPRLVSAAAVAGDTAYLLGGWDPETAGTGGIMLDTVHALNLLTRTWTRLPVRLPDGPTSRHVAVALPPGRGSRSNSRQRLLVHTHRCVDCVLLFDTVTQSFTKQNTTGVGPSPRGLHAAVVVNDTTVCLFGGAAQDQTMSNEAFLLDTVTWRWTKVAPSSSADAAGPCPRAGPCLVAADEQTVVAYGGARATAAGLVPCADLWALALDTGTWTELIPTTKAGAVPPPRNAATLTPVRNRDADGGGGGNSPGGKSFVLTGGWAPFSQTWDDCFVLRLCPE